MKLDSKIIWQTDRATVAYSFLANIALFLGYSEKQQDFLVRVHKELFNTSLPQKDTMEYQMLESLGKLPNSYHMSEIIKFTTLQKEQIKKWYLETLTVDPMIEILPFAMIEIKSTNQFILNL